MGQIPRSTERISSWQCNAHGSVFPITMYATQLRQFPMTAKQVLLKIMWEECVALTQLRKNVPTDYNRMPQIHPQNCPYPSDNNHLHLIHPSLNQPHSPPQMASGSTQPFCHSTLSGQTDRRTDQPTDWWSRWQTCTKSTYALLIESNALITITSPPQSHLGRARHYCHIGQCTLPLHVLAIQCAMLRNSYRTLLKHYGSITEHCRALQSVTERYRSVMEPLPKISCPYGNTVNFSKIRVKYISVQKIRHSAHSNQWGANAEKSPKQPLPLAACEPPSNTCMPGVTPLTTMTARLLHAFPHNYATKAPLVTPQNCPFPFDNHHPI